MFQRNKIKQQRHEVNINMTATKSPQNSFQLAMQIRTYLNTRRRVNIYQHVLPSFRLMGLIPHHLWKCWYVHYQDDILCLCAPSRLFKSAFFFLKLVACLFQFLLAQVTSPMKNECSFSATLDLAGSLPSSVLSGKCLSANMGLHLTQPQVFSPPRALGRNRGNYL